MTFFSGTFHHPRHGKFDDPQDVLDNDKLSHSEKTVVLDEWRASLEHDLRHDPDGSDMKAKRDSLDQAAEALVSAKT